MTARVEGKIQVLASMHPDHVRWILTREGYDGWHGRPPAVDESYIFFERDVADDAPPPIRTAPYIDHGVTIRLQPVSKGKRRKARRAARRAART